MKSIVNNFIYKVEPENIDSVFWLCEDIKYLDKRAACIFSYKCRLLKIIGTNLSQQEIEYILKLNNFDFKYWNI